MSRNENQGRNGKGIHYRPIDVPYECNYICFYCGQSADTMDHVPPISRLHDYMALYDRHPPITVPACSECNGLLSNSLQSDIFERFEEAKRKLTTRLKKYLRYSSVWDEDSLSDADFTGQFKKFADNVMIQASIAKERIEWGHWVVSIDGISVTDFQTKVKLELDGLEFKRYDHLLEYVKKVHKVAPLYFEKVVEIMGLSRLEFCLHYCKTHKPKNATQMEEYLKQLK